MTSRFSKFLSISIVLLIFCSCSDSNYESATMIIHGGTIYTVDSNQATVEAVAVKDNIILFAGSLEEAESFKNDQKSAKSSKQFQKSFKKVSK